MTTNASLFLLDIEEQKIEDVTVNSVVTAALAVENSALGKIDIVVASRMVLSKVIDKARLKYPNIKLVSFHIENGRVKGNGLVSFKPLLAGGKGVAVAVAEVKRYGKNEVAGYVLCDRGGRVAKISKRDVMANMMHNEDFVVNIKIVRDVKDKVFCSLKETDGILTYVVGLEESRRNTRKEVAKPVTKPMSKESKVDLKKRELLSRIRGSRLGKYVNEDYSLDCLVFLIDLAKRHVKYDHLLNSKYTWGQMAIINSGYIDGLDISLYSDPKKSEKEMNDIYIALKHGVWSNCTFM